MEAAGGGLEQPPTVNPQKPFGTSRRLLWIHHLEPRGYYALRIALTQGLPKRERAMRNGPNRDGKRTVGGEYRHRRRPTAGPLWPVQRNRRRRMAGIAFVLVACIALGMPLGLGVARLLHVGD
jgi:hypothetical protein